MQLFFYLPTFNVPCMRHLLYLMFRCDVNVMENLELGGVFFGTKHSQPQFLSRFCQVVGGERLENLRVLYLYKYF